VSSHKPLDDSVAVVTDRSSQPSPETHNRRLGQLRADQVADAITATSILLLPVGAVEQHGPHLPLNTDLVIATECAKALVTNKGDQLDLWLMEPLPYTKSNEHAGTAGTVWFGPETMVRLLDDIGRSVAATAAKKLVFLNGHGGNSSLLNVACRELRLNHGLQTFLVHPSLPPDQGGNDMNEPGGDLRGHSEEHDELGMGIHAGWGETSMMLHLRPELVDMTKAKRAVPEHLTDNSHVRFGGTVTFGWLASDFGPSGVIGDPTGANAAAGQKLFDHAVAQLSEALTEVAQFRFRPG